MNKIEVVSRNTFINDFSNNVSLYGDNDTLVMKINGVIEGNIMLHNNIYNKVVVMVFDDVVVNIFEIRENNKSDTTYQYILNNNSRLTINKFYCMDNYNEEDNIELNGDKASVIFNLSVISNGNQKYNINVSHNNIDTKSELNNHGVSIDKGMIEFIVNGKVKKGMTNSFLNQDNKIITMDNGKGVIKPNLYIDENMVEARHGASIGKFDDEEIFYMETRGIPASLGYKLLLKGFLLGQLPVNEEIENILNNIIDKVGR